MPRFALALILLALNATGPAPAGATVARSGGDRLEGRRLEAEALHRRAVALGERRTIEGRRAAISALERATLLDPGNAEYELTLARLYYESGFLKSARSRFEGAVALAPEDAEARFGLGQIWRRDWLKYLEPGSLERSIENLAAATRLAPTHADAWLLLSSLWVERGDLASARAAAEHALAAEPGRPEGLLAVASTRWRMGDVAGADSAFARAWPRLRPSVRERLEDIAPVASESDTAKLNHLPPAQRVEFRRRFWKEHDPDLATPENEAQLEYWARVAQAYFLFYDPRRREWDERGEVYVRYGPPEKADYNPVGQPLYVTLGHRSRIAYPTNVLVWSYPRLGMTVTLQDRILSEYYQLPIAYDHDPDPRPDPDSVAMLDALATRDGRGVFPMLPPGTQPLAVKGVLARFEGASLPRLVAGLEVPGRPSETITGDWVVLDSTQQEVARASRTLSPSACDVSARRVADFAADLPPGRYLVGLSAHSGSRRGVARIPVRLESGSEELALSDVVVTCGAPPVSGEFVRLAPNPGARVRDGDPLVAYFEIYGLGLEGGGDSRFEYVYTVRSGRRDTRVWLQRVFRPATPASITASGEAQQTGPMRRQFVSVPVQNLPPGHYRLEISVHDLVADATVKGRAEFLRVSPGSP